MDKKQEQYRPLIDKWKKVVKSTGTGWDEDDPMIPVDYHIDVDMQDYYLGGLFKVFDGEQAHLFSTPRCDILARVTKVKAHMNRMISSCEFAVEDLQKKAGAGNAVNIWEFVRLATEKLRDCHEGPRFRVGANSRIITRLAGHATGIPSSLPWEVGFSYEVGADTPTGYLPLPKDGVYWFTLKTTVFTVCPFVLFETDGQQSHTQRSHIILRVASDAPVIPGSLMREISTRLVPVMSNMKIPDEVIQVLKSYAGPTFTEDACVRVIKIIRGITAEFVPDGLVFGATCRVISEDSHLAHDIHTELTSDLS